MQLRTPLFFLFFFVLAMATGLDVRATAQDGGFGGPVPLGAAHGGPSSPHYFGPAYQGFGTYGFGTYGPGYYGPGFYGPGFYGPSVNGLRVGPPSAMSIDPSLRSHTYGGYSAPYVYPLRSPSGLPSLNDPLHTVTWPSRGKISINLSAESTGELAYTLNGVDYTIKPGYAQNFDDDRKWIISYVDSETKKLVRYTLTAGTYRFLPGKASYSLHEVTDKVTDKKNPASKDLKTPE